MPLALTASLACQITDDVGEPCDLGAFDGQEIAPGYREYSEIVEVSSAFPCDTLVCVTTEAHAAYCSKECRSDAGCPSAFECRSVTDAGPFAQQQFCVWRTCFVTPQCGDASRYRCVPQEGTSESYCALRDGS